tara:strand:+ start:1188 stop:1523 length:336 start_codon:yes stop_codon:yes gene_type:complete
MSDFTKHYKITFEMTCPHTGKIYQRTLHEAETHDQAVCLIIDVVEGRHKEIKKYADPYLFSAAFFTGWGEETAITDLLRVDVVRKKRGEPYLWDEIKQRGEQKWQTDPQLT